MITSNLIQFLILVATTSSLASPIDLGTGGVHENERYWEERHGSGFVSNLAKLLAGFTGKTQEPNFKERTATVELLPEALVPTMKAPEPAKEPINVFGALDNFQVFKAVPAASDGRFEIEILEDNKIEDYDQYSY